MSWTVVARKDFQDARRSRALWVLSALFLGFTLLMTYVYSVLPSLTGDDAAELSTVGLLGFLSSPATLFISLAALIVCYKAIAGESESGSGKLLLGLPFSRRDVVLGKIVGRWLTVTAPLIGGLLAALVAIFALRIPFATGNFELAVPFTTTALGTPVPAWAVTYTVFLAVTALFALVYVSLIVGISATTTSTARAAALAVSAWVVLEVLWDVVPLGALFVANGFRFPSDMATMPDWVLGLNNLAPSAAYLNAASGFISGVSTSGDVPFYLTQWFSVLVLLAWIVVPTTVGYLVYRRADL